MATGEYLFPLNVIRERGKSTLGLFILTRRYRTSRRRNRRALTTGS